MEEIKKYTCKCESCSREFDEEEYQITQDKNKCIFHCEKTNWEKLDENERKIRQQKFNKEFLKFCSNLKDGEIKEFHFYDTFNLLKEIDDDKFFFRQCHFHGFFHFNNYLKEHYLFLDNCFFYKGVNFFRDINSEFNFVNACQFNNKSINLSGVFSKKLSFIGSNNINEINCNSVVFKDDVVLSNLIVENCADFQFTKFYKNCSFSQSRFDSIVNFNETNFIGNVNFSLFYSKCKLDLSNAVLEGQTNFLKLKVTIANRETARIIKDSFEQQNNIIEANKFYALEMKERENELEKDLKEGKNFFEWLVFKIHGLSSNHSQDWLLALYWIFIIGFISSYYDFNLIQHEGKYVHYELSSVFKTVGLIFVVLFFYCICKIKDKFVDGSYFIICFYLVYIYSTEDYLLSLFSKTINPFSVMKTNDPINGIQLFFKIIITYLIYQLIISIRQNTRRK